MRRQMALAAIASVTGALYVRTAFGPLLTAAVTAAFLAVTHASGQGGGK